MSAFASINEGQPSQVYPALAQASPELFGRRGRTRGCRWRRRRRCRLHDHERAKPFVFALVCAALGPGLPFNSVTAVEQDDEGRTNPMVNSGAIATTGLVPGAAGHERWRFIVDGLSRFAGRQLALDDEVYRSASETNYVNRSIANLLESRGAVRRPLPTPSTSTRDEALSP